MNIVIAAGGTGGHIFPALRFGEIISGKYKNAKIYFICEKGNKFRRTIAKSFKCIEIRQKRFSGKPLFYKFFASVGAVFSIFQSVSLLKKIKPAIVIGVGGFASFSVVFSAYLLKIPVIIHEQNVIPGFTNAFLSRFADVVGVSFPESKDYFSKKNVILIGNPVYNSEPIERENPQIPYKVLVFGGSQGAHILNETVLNLFETRGCETMSKSYIFTLITGFRDYSGVKSRSKGMKGIKVIEFSDNMPELYKQNDIVISRAGATTIAEICSYKIPSILIPFAAAYKQHQDYNALFLANRGAAIVIHESELSVSRLQSALDRALRPEFYKEMINGLKGAYNIEPREKFLENFDKMIELERNKGRNGCIN